MKQSSEEQNAEPVPVPSNKIEWAGTLELATPVHGLPGQGEVGRVRKRLPWFVFFAVGTVLAVGAWLATRADNETRLAGSPESTEGQASAVVEKLTSSADLVPDTRPATLEELRPPSDVLLLLRGDLGAELVTLTAADVRDGIAIKAMNSYLNHGPKEKIEETPVSDRYLVRVANLERNTELGLTVGTLEWIVYYHDFFAPVYSPVLENGESEVRGAVTRGYVLVNSETGAVDIAHWRD